MAIGAGLVSPPVLELNTMNAITTKYLQPIMGDAIFWPSPLYGEFFREGRKMEAASIPFSVASSVDTSGGAYWGAQVLASQVTDNVSAAEQQWRFYRQPVVIPETDMLLNLASNPAGVQNLLRTKMMIAAGSFLQLLSTAPWGDTGQPSAIRIDDIYQWLDSTNNAITIAGIDRSAAGNTFWQANTKFDFVGATTVQGLHRAFWNYAGQMGYDYPQLMAVGPNNYATLEPLFTQNVRYTSDEFDKRAVQSGMRQHFMFKSCVVIQDPYLGGNVTGTTVSVPANSGYIINYNYIFPVFFSLLYFNFRPWMSPSMQFIMVSYIRLGWQLVCISPKKAGIAMVNMS